MAHHLLLVLLAKRSLIIFLIFRGLVWKQNRNRKENTHSVATTFCFVG